jgi:hypothetical protein
VFYWKGDRRRALDDLGVVIRLTPDDPDPYLTRSLINFWRFRLFASTVDLWRGWGRL